ncbi:MAG: HIT domain-containing protein [bacterium]|nr:HIT domain-containing protein [bacterium]
MSCLFCQIAAHEIHSKIKYEDDDFIAFDDIHPKAKIHILLIPKKHIHSVAALEDSDVNLVGKLILKARDIAKEQGIDLSGFRLVFNSGPDAGQIVDHLHLHIIGGEKL